MMFRGVRGAAAVAPPFIPNVSPNRFVITQANNIFYSDDQGVTWAAGAVPPVTPEFMCWDGSRWLIYIYTGAATDIYQSPDVAAPWTIAGSTGASWSRGLFFDGTRYYIARAGGFTPNFRRATVLGSWTSIPGIPSTGQIRNIGRRGTRWVAIGDVSSTGVSTDGLAFTAITVPAGSPPWTFSTPVSIDGTSWALFSNDSASISDYYTTSDFITYTLRAFPAALNWRELRGYASNGTRIVIPTSDGLYTSTDLISWTRVHDAGVHYGTVRWNGTTWLGLPWSTGTSVARSSDGVTWANQATSLPAAAFKRIRTEDLSN